jgi:hypothetical protein
MLAKFKKTFTSMKSTDHKMAQNVKKTRIVCGIKKDGSTVKKNLMLLRDFVLTKIYFQ